MKDKFKVAFIKPNMGLVHGKPYYDRGRMEPLTFAVLAGMLPEDVDCVLYDDRFERIPFSKPVDLVAINVEIYTARRAYEISREYRKRGIKVVLGGYHVSMIPEEAAENADAIMIGDSEAIWPQVVSDSASGKLKKIYNGFFPPILKGLKTKWEIFDGKSYLPIRLIQFSRGCINHCKFCATGTLYKRTHVCRPPEEVVNELAEQKCQFVFFVDDNIIADPDTAKDLFRRLIPLKKKWIGQASLNFTNDPELMDLMKKSGCAGLVIGFETVVPENLALMEKNCNLQLESYESAIEKTRKMGLMLWGAFLIGYDHDDINSIRKTVQWAIDHKFCFSAFNILSPYPSTIIYEEMKNQNRLLYDKWWLDDRYHFGDAVFKPAHMTSEELTDACFWARRRFNNPLTILKRALDFETNAKDLWSILTFFAYNPLFRRELFKKHGMVLGYRGKYKSF
ncbi:MAG: B12-binding domain-containing radical SAM protein [Candidatus Riflebacteria bacterium]|nr:B12-binding domain-containing radical SAM protein [Candidatus Riflebacteria bacterium]